jgi:hypothetical protein
MSSTKPTEPKRLTRDEIYCLVHTIDNSSLSVHQDADGNCRWATDADEEGLELMSQLAHTTGSDAEEVEVEEDSDLCTIPGLNDPREFYEVVSSVMKDFDDDDDFEGRHRSLSRTSFNGYTVTTYTNVLAVDEDEEEDDDFGEVGK